jgi:hypothetical protein
MKKPTILFYGAALWLALAALFTACRDTCEVRQTYVYYEPVYATTAEIRAATKMEPTRVIEHPGKIYFKDGFLFVTEKDKGIHIIDNRDPRMPVMKAFLAVPGTIDVAILGNYLYADSFVDLVVFDVTNIDRISEVGRLEGVFDQVSWMGFRSTSQMVIRDWRAVEHVQLSEGDCEQRREVWGGIFFRNGFLMEADAAVTFNHRQFSAGPVAGGATAGVGGSMARFTINHSYLYALDGPNLEVISLATPARPTSENEQPVAWDIETVFPGDKRLYIGAQTGMYIYDLTDPVKPDRLSKYEHVRSCDPVVVEGNHAFVTLRNGSICAGFTNQLEVIDISNPRSPRRLHVYPMTHPHGLGIDRGTLFICDGRDGLKVYDARDVAKISENLLAHEAGIHAFDVIPLNYVAMMVGNDGIYQYDYRDIRNISLLSQIAIKPR